MKTPGLTFLTSLVLLFSTLCPPIAAREHLNPHDRLNPVDTAEIETRLSKDLEEKERGADRFYAVVIDAGSTGTRLHLFEFNHNRRREHSPFQLVREHFKEVKPGLSSFAPAPEQAAESVRELLVVARAVVPEKQWATTPITLKATAGIRLLPEQQADNILAHVEDEVASSGFLTDDDSVGVLSGTDEGVFGWFTLNFLLNRLQNVVRSDSETVVDSSVAAMDLGGGSTQITFLPADFESAMRGIPRQKYSHKLRLFGKELRLYTHSYLGNGLVAARLGVAKLLSPARDVERHQLTTHCMPIGYHLDDWDYAGRVWMVHASADAGFDACLASTREYVRNVTGVEQVHFGGEEVDVYAFSYFYDRALQAGLVGANGGWLKVDDYRRAAERACALTVEELGPEHWRPWQCLDLSYIYSLLRYGYGFADDRKIHPVKKLQEMEVSWALGAGFHLLNTYHERSSSTVHDSHRSHQLLRSEKQNSTSPRRSFLSVVMDGRDMVRERGSDGCDWSALYRKWLLAYVKERMVDVLSYLKILS